MSEHDRLERARFVWVSARRKGMVKVVLWHDPKTGEVIPQKGAMRRLKERAAIRAKMIGGRA